MNSSQSVEEQKPVSPGTTRKRKTKKGEEENEAQRIETERAVAELAAAGGNIMSVRARVVDEGKVKAKKVWHRVAVMPGGEIFFVDHGMSSPVLLMAEFQLIKDADKATLAEKDCCYGVLFELLNHKSKGFRTLGIHVAGGRRHRHGVARSEWHRDLWSDEVVRYFGDVYVKRTERLARKKDPYPIDPVYMGIPFAHSAELRLRPVYNRLQKEAEDRLDRVETYLRQQKKCDQHGQYDRARYGTYFDYFSALGVEPLRR
jgi:hypothetical protein